MLRDASADVYTSWDYELVYVLQKSLQLLYRADRDRASGVLNFNYFENPGYRACTRHFDYSRLV